VCFKINASDWLIFNVCFAIKAPPPVLKFYFILYFRD
jgi:hypothetical protein